MKAIIQDNNVLCEKQKLSMYALRSKTFCQRLNWKVNSHSGYEYDEFDNSSTVYSLISDDSKVVACTRLLKTTGAYMLKNVFPQLAKGEKIPERDDILEISRFAIDKAFSRNYRGQVSSLTYNIFQSLYIYAVENNVNNYVIVTTVAAEKIMRKMGLPIRRFGDGNETMIGETRSVGLWLKVDRTFAQAVGN